MWRRADVGLDAYSTSTTFSLLISILWLLTRYKPLVDPAIRTDHPLQPHTSQPSFSNDHPFTSGFFALLPHNLVNLPFSLCSSFIRVIAPSSSFGSYALSAVPNHRFRGGTHVDVLLQPLLIATLRQNARPLLDSPC